MGLVGGMGLVGLKRGVEVVGLKTEAAPASTKGRGQANEGRQKGRGMLYFCNHCC